MIFKFPLRDFHGFHSSRLFRDLFLLLQKISRQVYLVYFALGSCAGDPDLCGKGLTIMFWIHMTVEMTSKQVKRGFNTQYVLSSGSQEAQR